MAMSVAATRYMIQDELLIQTTGCDTCIITTMIVLGEVWRNVMGHMAPLMWR